MFFLSSSIFGIVGVQLWAGLLRQRCYLELPPNVSYLGNIPSFYKLDDDEELEYICSLDKDGGMHRCANLPAYEQNNIVCNGSAVPSSNNIPQNGTCVNWNQYYTLCRAGDRNPFQGAISFDNIGLAWVAIFLVISLEGWSDIMYYVQDAHSFWDWIYFVLLIVIGSFFMINLCLVVIATQFSETKKREMERMRLERARFHSNSTLTSNSASEPTSCYTEIIKYLAHLWRRARRKFCRWYRHTKRKRRREEVPHAISLRTKRIRPPWQPGQSAMKRVESVHISENVPQPRDSIISNENFVSKLQEPSDCTIGTPTSDSPPAPCASPEISDIDPVASPRRPTVLKVSDPEHRCSGAECTLTIEGNDGQRHSPSPKTVILRPTRNPSSGSGGSRRTSQLTCAELLALSGAQSAALAASLASNYTMQRFYSTLRRERKHYSAPHLLFYYPEEDKDLPLSFSESGWTDSDLDSELEDDGECNSSRGKCYEWWKICQATIKKIVDHRYFQRGILTAILINTLSMGIEYHNQPEELTQAVELSNLIFTGIFSTEMIMKLLGDGFCGYIRSGFNVFDGVIVILSVIELSQSSGSGLSVLRTFRLLRILKLVRFMPALRRQLVIMLRTVDNVAVFFALLILFIFIFSCLGMYLFGGKLCTRNDGSGQCNCEDLRSDPTQCSCDRKQFDNILWATVTVFQILTQEDWNIVLFNGMELTSHWAALYFVALMTFGNYVLFNLLVAILVEGFSQEDDKKKSDEVLENTSPGRHGMKGNKNRKYMIQEVDPKDNIEKETIMRHNQPDRLKQGCQTTDHFFPPIITHTAATPQGSPCANLDPVLRDLNNRLSPSRAFNISASSIDTIDKSSIPPSLHIQQCSLSQSTCGDYSQESDTLTVPQIYVCTSPSLSRKSSLASSKSRRGSDSSYSERKRSSSPTPLQRQNSKNNSCSSPKVSRRGSIHSWKLKKKKKSTKDSSIESDSDSLSDEEQEVILNNMNNQLNCGFIVDHRHCNGRLPTLVNTPINKTNNDTIENTISTTRTPSPQYSIKNQYPEGMGEVVSIPHTDCCSRRRSGSVHNSINDNDQNPSSGLSLVDSSLKEDFKPNNLSNMSQYKTENTANAEKIDFGEKKLCWFFEWTEWMKDRESFSLFLFSPSNRVRKWCTYLAHEKWFDYSILVFIGLNCITLAMERPNIPPNSTERMILTATNYIFTVVFAFEMLIKVIAKGLWYGGHAYFKTGWNIMDGSLVMISLVDVLLSFVADGSPRIFGILRVFRLLRSLRPLRVINRAPGLKLVVQTLLSSLRPIGNIVLICCTFFIIFGILGVQLFKGSFYYCEGPDVKDIKNKTQCLEDKRNEWINQKYNFDNLGQALMSLFVLSSKDGWVNIMYTGLDAVGIDQQPIENYSEWRLLYFISFLLLVAFFVLNMFVGVVVENFHRCREEQEKEEKARRAAKRARKLEKKKRKMREPPYYINYSKPRLFTHNIITSKYFDLAIAAVIGLNVVTMATEFYMMPTELTYALKIFNYFFTAVFILEAVMKVVALGFRRYLKDKWNQLDVIIVILSIVGIVLEEMESEVIPINPTIIRVMRVLRIARVLKLLKMAKGIRALLDTVMQALPQVGNLGLLFFLLFFIFAALGVELFGRLECTEIFPCQGLGEHAHFRNFGMAFLTLFRVATGDNWNGIMKDTLRDNCDSSSDCIRNCCVSPIIAPLYFVIFVLMAQFVLVNVVVAVLMKHLEESHKQMDDDLEMDVEIERELAAEAEEREARHRKAARVRQKERGIAHRTLVKMSSLPANFTFTFQEDTAEPSSLPDECGVSVAAVTIEISEAPFDDGIQTEVSAESPLVDTTVNIKRLSPEDHQKQITTLDHSLISIPIEESPDKLDSHQKPQRPRDIPHFFVPEANLSLTPEATLTSVSTGSPTPQEVHSTFDDDDSGTSTQCLLQTYPELGNGQSPDSGSWNVSSHSEMASESWPRTTDTETYEEDEEIEDPFSNIHFAFDETRGEDVVETRQQIHSVLQSERTPTQENQGNWTISDSDTSPDC
ncbi:voltage-dependent T-type calcium channel subunit alpha-1H-like isoform X2 [Centruroides vittatus]|uniref:voltage-dependent T-type calcium channel subunit alpha-1H-like isoform X2 n=1 Tax=Centruroides vittatus TaxID=120091 RepID=UPI00350F9742